MIRLPFRRAAPLLLAAASACWVPVEKGRQMEARLDRLETESAESTRRIEEQRALVKDRVAKLDQKLVEVQEKIDELNKAARRSGADLSVNLTRLQDEFSRVKGDLEVEQHRLGAMEQGLAQLRTDTDGRFAALKGAGALDEYEAKRKASELQRPDDKAAFFALAQKEDQQGDLGVARQLYDEYVKRWPSDPRAAEASFRAGQILSGQRRYREAILAYGKVAEDFPRSNRAPDALLALAESMVQLDMQEDARAILGQVMEKYPKSDAAPRARKRLAELEPSPAAPKKKKAPAPAAKPKPQQ
jgi:tol-pal system protein YbgF